MKPPRLSLELACCEVPADRTTARSGAAAARLRDRPARVQNADGHRPRMRHRRHQPMRKHRIASHRIALRCDAMLCDRWEGQLWARRAVLLVCAGLVVENKEERVGVQLLKKQRVLEAAPVGRSDRPNGCSAYSTTAPYSEYLPGLAWPVLQCSVPQTRAAISYRRCGVPGRRACVRASERAVLPALARMVAAALRSCRLTDRRTPPSRLRVRAAWLDTAGGAGRLVRRRLRRGFGGRTAAWPCPSLGGRVGWQTKPLACAAPPCCRPLPTAASQREPAVCVLTSPAHRKRCTCHTAPRAAWRSQPAQRRAVPTGVRLLAASPSPSRRGCRAPTPPRRTSPRSPEHMRCSRRGCGRPPP